MKKSADFSALFLFCRVIWHSNIEVFCTETSLHTDNLPDISYYGQITDCSIQMFKKTNQA